MKRTYSRIISILLTFVLVMSSAALAFADDQNGGGQQSGQDVMSEEGGTAGGGGESGDTSGGAGDENGQSGQQGDNGDTGDVTDPGSGSGDSTGTGDGTGTDPGNGQHDPDEPSCTEHSVEEWTVLTEATCTEPGSREGVCTNCGESVTDEIPAAGHQWGAWKTVKAATYIANGSAQRLCAVCEAKETKVLPRLKAYNKWVTVSGKKYYLNSAGNVVKGWQKIRISNKKKATVKWCWFNSSGVFRKSVKKNTKNKWVTVDGKKFWFTKSKAPIGPGFHFIKGKLYYMLADKSMAKGTFKASDGKTYTTTKAGYITGIEYYKHKYSSFILVDISDQNLKYYSGGKVRLNADVVTGKKGSHDTPTGTFRIRGKSRNTTLTGPTWSSKVSYWMAFIGSSYGMHDASWRTSAQFSNHKTYVRNGSHGCINMRYKDAKYLYENAGKGTPVIVQK